MATKKLTALQRLTKLRAQKAHSVPLSQMHPSYRAGYALGQTMSSMIDVIPDAMDRKTFVTGFGSGCIGAPHVAEKRGRVKRKGGK